MDATPPLTRRMTPWILGIALLFLTAMAFMRVFALRQELATQVRRQLEDDLRDRVETWESALEETLSQWSEVGGASPDEAPSLQARMRNRRRFFDSLYVWRPAEQIRTNDGVQQVPGKFYFPRAAFRERREVLASVPCLTAARTIASRPDATEFEVSAAYRLGCRTASPQIRTVALTEAVARLLYEKRFADAFEALELDGIPPEVTLRTSATRGIWPFRAMVLKFQRAEAMYELGDEQGAFELLLQISREIADLDAPDAANLIQWMDQVIFDLRKYDQPNLAVRVEAIRARTHRKINGFQEVSRSLLTRLPPETSEPPRFIYDQYNENTYVLFNRWRSGTQNGVALQLDQADLLDDFLRSARRFRGQLVILDADRTPHAGVTRPAEIAFEVPFRRTLPHLRVALLQSTVDARLSRLDKEWVVPALLAAMMLLMGFLALYEQVRASRQQTLLLTRQREFATRVTHELKTPLAGIKVMAENLELGLFKTDAERTEMAQSIIREADNLTARVNEILSVAKERTLRPPERFDPEEPLFEAIEAWGPRLEAAGVELEADLDATDMVLGDWEAVRDAVACLLDNALKYRREDRASVVRLTLVQRGDSVEIRVEDNGLGVPAAMRAQIFERFVRVEGPNRGKSGGHGLGLAQVAQIVHGHGGSARCEEGIDGGAAFILSLPVIR